MTKFTLRHLLIGSILFLISFVSVQLLNTPNAYAGTYQDTALAAYNNMPSRLPDGKYRLLKNSDNSLASTTYCSNNPDSCHASGAYDVGSGSDEHQYMTVSGDDNINDTGTGTSSPGYKEINLVIYSGAAADRDLSFLFVDRRRNNDCETTLALLYFKNFPGEATPIADEVYNPPGPGNCNQSRTATFPASKFARYYEKDGNGNDRWTGLYKGYIRIKLKLPAVRQASFSIAAANGGKLGYRADSFINMYPTALADGHTIIFRWRPPCGYSDNKSYTYDDGDEGNVHQQADADLRVISQIPDPNNPQNTAASSNRVQVGGQSLVRQNTQFINMTGTRSYSAEFSNIDGGNGIGFVFPFDTGSFYIPCPLTPTAGGSAACDNISFAIPGGGNTTRAYKVYIRPRSDSPGAIGEAAMIAPGGTQIASSTATHGSTVSIKASDYYMAGYFEYAVLVYNGIDGTTGRDSNFDGDGSLYGNVGACYMATCTVTTGSVLGPGRAIAGQPFDVNVTITADSRNINTIPQTRNIGGTNYRLAGTLGLDGKWSPPDGDQWGGVLAPAYINNAPGGIEPGDSADRDFTQTAPTGQGTHDVNMYPDYWLKGGIGPLCAGSASAVTTYDRYDFTGNSSTGLIPDAESPAKARFSTGVTQSPSGVVVDGTVTRTFYKKDNVGFGPLPSFSGSDPKGNPHSTVFGSFSYTDEYVIPVGTYLRGDIYCVAIVLDRGHGYRSGVDYIFNTPESSSNCFNNTAPEIVDLPYLRTYGADVVAGGGFVNSSCGASASGIFAFMRPLNEQTAAGNRSGSGSQLATMSLGNTSGFTSASLRNQDPVSEAGNGLTFSHGIAAPNNTVVDAVLGGPTTAGNGWCAPDYYTDTQFPDSDTRKKIETNPGNINANSLTDHEQTRKDIGGGEVRVIGDNSFNKRHTVFVDGDVFIKSNIIYTSAYTSIDTIPNFTLIVKGNIYINRDVTQLDGLYVAQPRPDGSKGKIYTCARETGPSSDIVISDPAEVFTYCGGDGTDRRLVINGALVANQVVFNRASYTLRDSRYREGPYMPNLSHAAEVINFSPEMFLAPPTARAKGTLTSGDYDYIATLPPIL